MASSLRPQVQVLRPQCAAPERIAEIEPAPAGELTCALSGNGILSTFLQERPFYTAFHVARLVPRRKMLKAQMLYYAMCIKANAYRYSYGRQANRSLRDILLPALTDIPKYVEASHTELFEGAQHTQRHHYCACCATQTRFRSQDRRS